MVTECTQTIDFTGVLWGGAMRCPLSPSGTVWQRTALPHSAKSPDLVVHVGKKRGVFRRLGVETIVLANVAQASERSVTGFLPV